MSVPTPASAPPIIVSEGDRAYVGYRRRGTTATPRLPCGACVHVPSFSDGELAAVVLHDRLGRGPTAALVDRFALDWVRRPRGEFVWPVAAVDDWLERDGSVVAELPRPQRVRSAYATLHLPLHHLLAAFFPRVAPASPRGGY
jgi:hypothetical protein